MSWEKITPVNTVSEKPTLIQWNKIPLCITKKENELFVFDDRCPHRGGPFSEGVWEKDSVTCPWHKAKFHLKDGHKIEGPECRDIKRIPAREVDGWIEIETL